jgi:arginyl-tRNA synthetase
MHTIIHQLDTAFRAAITAALGLDADPQLSVAQNGKFGDYQANAAMGLAKRLTETTGEKTNPRAVAEKIKAKLDLGEMSGEISIAGPGFINVRLEPAWVAKQLRSVAKDHRLGIEPVSDPRRIVIDYSGPNIAKEMHVGHLRSTIIGDCFVRTLSFLGHEVIRQNHIGDWGLQMGMVTFALEQEGATDRPLALGDLERMYKRINAASEDPAVRKQMAERTRALQQTPKDQLIAWKKVRELTLASAQDIYRQLGVTLTEADVRGESAYSNEYGPMIEMLRLRGLAKETEGAVGIFPPGFINRDGEPRPFIIQSRDGSYQYPTFDLAALTYRVEALRAQRIIYTHDSRQAEHFDMLFAVARMIGLAPEDQVRLEFASFGTILGADGKPLKTRKGENVKLKDLLAEAEERVYGVVAEKNRELPEEQRRKVAHAVGIGAVKYADLSKDRTSDYVFAWDKMLSLEGNTGPYLQYAYARIRSIFRKAGASSETSTAQVILGTPFELTLAKHILRLGEIVELVARELKPHHLCSYLYELATKFSSFYENCPVLQADEVTRASRLILCQATAKTMALGLNLLGIEHPEQM